MSVRKDVCTRRKYAHPTPDSASTSGVAKELYNTRARATQTKKNPPACPRARAPSLPPPPKSSATSSGPAPASSSSTTTRMTGAPSLSKNPASSCTTHPTRPNKNDAYRWNTWKTTTKTSSGDPPKGKATPEAEFSASQAASPTTATCSKPTPPSKPRRSSTPCETHPTTSTTKQTSSTTSPEPPHAKT